MIDHWIGMLGWAIFGLWALIVLPTLLFLYRRTLLRMSSLAAPLSDWPRLSVVVPARDEGAKIEATLRSLLASDYADLEVIAVNDHSTDQTGTIMDRLSAEDQRLRVIHVDALPDGWLGKNHALQQGADRAGGEYLLFTDGDILFAGDVLQHAVRYVVRAKVDHLCLMPRLIAQSYWDNALTAYFGFLMTSGMFVWLVPTPLKWVYAGVGAFNLVRRDLYVEAGGHEPIRLDVLDDVKLGKLMKRRGGRSDLLLAGRFVRVKWQEKSVGVVRGLEKNAFAAVEYSLWRLSLVTLVWGVMTLAPYAAIFALPPAESLGFAAALLLLHAAYGLMAERFGASWRVFPLLPAAGLVMIWAFWRSAWITLRQGGVRWRDTFYRLDALRQGMFR